MPFVEITEKQEKILDEAEFSSLVLDRNNITSETQQLRNVSQFVYSGTTKINIAWELMVRREKISEIDEKLAVLRKKLGIETPTLHTEL